MNLTLNNIAVIQEAKIELDGITVLAGYNGTGKSTISKALYSIISAYVNLPEKISNARMNSVHKIITAFIDQVEGGFFFEDDKNWERVSLLTKQFINKEKRVPQNIEEFIALCPELFEDVDRAEASEYFPQFIAQLQDAIDRPDKRYIEFLVGETIRDSFDSQVNTVGDTQRGEIHLAHNAMEIYTIFDQNKVVECSEMSLKERLPIYIEPKHLLDDLQNGHRRFQPKRLTPLQRILLSERAAASERTLEDHEQREFILERMDSVIHGGLVSTKSSLAFMDENCNDLISLKNVASGNKTVAVLKRLVENGAIYSNSILIIDEPEMNLHPAWQLKMAEILVLLNCKIGVKVFLNTHSPYFLRAIEVFSEKYETTERCHYYKTEPSDMKRNMYKTIDVTEKTELVYHDLYMPFEEM